MAQLVALMATAHVPGQTSSPQAAEPAKLAVVRDVWSRLGELLRAARPDLLVAISNDHYQNFLAVVPPFCVGTGESHWLPEERFAAPLRLQPRRVAGSPDMAALLLHIGEQQGMPLAFADRLEFIDELSLPVHLLRLDEACRLLPILTNCLHRHRPGARSFLKLGQVIAQLVAQAPAELRIAVLATGGLSHDPMGPEWGLIDEAFDRRFLALVEAGDLDQLLAEVTPARIDEAGKGGTPETLNWFCALGVAGPGVPAQIHAYVAVPEWATGLGFATWPVDPAGPGADHRRDAPGSMA